MHTECFICNIFCFISLELRSHINQFLGNSLVLLAEPVASLGSERVNLLH